MAIGMIELLALFFFAGGDIKGDLISFVDADDYFQAHSIKVSNDKMLELAATDPKDGVTQARQLLAIRVLGERRAELVNAKAVEKATQLLSDIAAGNKAQDELGFSKVYAEAALARLQGKKLPLQSLPKDSVRKDALSWFPKSATMVAAADIRGGVDSEQTTKKIRDFIAQKLPAPQKEGFFSFVNTVGNASITRFGLCLIPGEGDTVTVAGRLTGKVLPERLLKFLESIKKAQNVTRKKGPDGKTLTLIKSDNDRESMVFVGVTDFVFCGGNPKAKSSDELLKQVLAIRAGKAPSVLTGSMNSDLKRVSATASGLALGRLPKAATDQFGMDLKRFFVTSQRAKNGVHVDAEVGMATANEAMKLQQVVLATKMKFLQGLDMFQKQVQDKFMQKLLKQAREAAQEMEVKSQGKSVSVSVQLPSTAGMILFFWVGRAEQSMIRMIHVDSAARFGRR